MYIEGSDHANVINLNQLKAQITGPLKAHMSKSVHGNTVNST